MAIIGVTAIRLLSRVFQVVFIDCPFRLSWRSTYRQPCVFVESLLPLGEDTHQLDSVKGCPPKSYRPAVRVRLGMRGGICPEVCVIG